MRSSMAKNAIDWDAMEPDWRAGIKSKKELSEEHGVSRAAIDKHLAELGIERDLTAKIAEKVVLKPEVDEFGESGFIYIIYLDAPDRYYKIGMAKHFNSRFSQHQCVSPFDLCVASVFFVPNMRAAERELHSAFADKRVRGEWFSLTIDDVREAATRAVLV